MKRGGRLARRTPLKAKAGLKRGGRLRQRSSSKQAALSEQRLYAADLLAAAWRLDCIGIGVCACCGGRASQHNPLQAHHVLPKEYIKRYVKGLALPQKEAVALLLELLWDKRNSMALLKDCHAPHTTGKRRVRWACLEARHLQFADALGMLYVLEKQYPGGPT